MILIIILIVLILLFSILVYDSYKKIDISEYNINNEKIDKDLKIIVLSDLHNRNIKDRLDIILKDLNPDLIILSGDMINEYIEDTKNFLSLCKVLNNYKTYYTFGNHEEKLNEVEKNKYYELLSKTNLIILNNKSINLSNNIMLYGFNCDISYFEGFRKKELNSKEILNKFDKIDEKLFNILIAHDPLKADVYAKCNFDLTISGHVHGGLIKLPFLGGVLSPDYTLFPKYYQGINNINNMKLIVSRGLGFCKKIPFRILNHGEVVVINVMKNK